jgi:hypothetical protein
MSDEQAKPIQVRVNGRAYPVKFTGTSNRTSYVEGFSLDPNHPDYRRVQTNWGQGDADFYMPAVKLASICSNIAKEHGVGALKAVIEDVDRLTSQGDERLTQLQVGYGYEMVLPSVVAQYFVAWNKVMGGAESAIIFRQDLKDIVRTIEEVYKSQESAKGAAR